jgi:serpin B
MRLPSIRELALVVGLSSGGLAGCQPDPKLAPEQNGQHLTSEQPTLSAHVEYNRPSEVVTASNAFGLHVYARVKERPGNQLISPACITAGLSLVYAGARGETARQIAHVMQANEPLQQGLAPYGALIKGMNADGGDHRYQIKLANALWVQKGYPLLDSYRATLRDVFLLDDNTVDFAQQPAEACRTINNWVTTRTSGKITRILETNDLPDRTQLALTTALYFRANWRSRFEKESTVPSPFHLDSKKSIEVPMMCKSSTWKVHSYFDGGSFQAVQLPLGTRGQFAMVVFLPRKIDGLPGFESSLTEPLLQSWWPRFRLYDEVGITLPRYRIRTELGLAGVLFDLGMPLAFKPRADFSGINGRQSDLFLARAQHSTYLDVDEEGVEGAASMGTISADSFGDAAPPQIDANHPFFFLIRDTRSGLILFIGRVMNPLETGP